MLLNRNISPPKRIQSPGEFSNASSCSSQEAYESNLQIAINYTELNRKNIEEIIGMKPLDIILHKRHLYIRVL